MIARRTLSPASAIDSRISSRARRASAWAASSRGNIDHVVPRSRGGKTSWDNCVLAHREINSRKADRLPHEAGLRLRKPPVAPRVVPATALIRNHHGDRDWEHFLG